MTTFDLHTIETAPQASQPLLEGAEKTFGFIPNLQRVFAESPALLEGYMTLWDVFAKSSFTPVEQQVVYLASNYENECHYCMAGHTGLAKMAGVPDDVIAAIRDGQPIADPKLEALRQFTAKIVVSRGWVEPNDVAAFIAAGYTKEAILDVILGAAVKVMSNYTNHIAETPVDDVMRGNAWTHPDKRTVAAE